MKNVTLSIDEQLLQAGREYARKHNISFNVLVRHLVKQTVVQQSNQWLEDIFSLMDKWDPPSDLTAWDRGDQHRG